jgi:L-cysteate sulfo-lyase
MQRQTISAHRHYAARLEKFPPIGLIEGPTPLRALRRLSDFLGGPNIWIKRDDATHISSGGNKLRKLDRVLHSAAEQGADCLVSGGVPQSNSQRQVATAAAMLGLEAHLCVFQGRVAPPSPAYDVSGNIVLNHLFGAQLHPAPWEGDRNGPIETLAERLRGEGKRPFVIPYGVSNAMGALSYSSVVQEIAAQSEAEGFMPDVIIAASGSGGTQAGVTLGTQACLPQAEAVCIDVDADAQRVKSDAAKYGRQAGKRLGIEFETERLELIEGYSGGAYGHVDAATIAAMSLAARLEAVILDPVYTGKAMAGLLGLIRAGRFHKGQDIVFIHTGGMPAVFAYAENLTGTLAGTSA